MIVSRMKKNRVLFEKKNEYAGKLSNYYYADISARAPNTR